MCVREGWCCYVVVNGIAQGCGSLSWSWYLRGGEYGDRLACSSEEQGGCLDLRGKIGIVTLLLVMI